MARWFVEATAGHSGFATELVELADVGLPLLDEPEHPRLARYENAHTKAWSRRVAAADAFVLVTPEYNYGSPPALVNALDYLSREWAYKAVGFVSYGGLSGGTRSVQMTKLVLTALRMMPVPEAVAIPFFSKQMKDGRFEGSDAQLKVAHAMLDEISRWTVALEGLRQAAREAARQ